MSDETPLVRRVRVAEATIAKFAGQPFQWGRTDCLRMVAHALRGMGHTPPLRQAGNYSTLLGAHRALKRTGYATLDAWIDAWGLPRIPASMTLPSDILALHSDVPSMPALALRLSGDRFLCLFRKLERRPSPRSRLAISRSPRGAPSTCRLSRPSSR